jgi:hypothetical protein
VSDAMQCEMRCCGEFAIEAEGVLWSECLGYGVEDF